MPSRRSSRRKKKTNTARLQLRATYEPYATLFLEHINSSPEIRSRSSDRNEVDRIFDQWHQSNPPPSVRNHDSKDDAEGANKSSKYFCSQVMAHLRVMKLLKTKRTGDIVLCVFAESSVPGSFPPMEERKTAREELLRRRKELESDKGGMAVQWLDEFEMVDEVVPKGHKKELLFVITDCSGSTDRKVTVSISISGANRRWFSLGTGTKKPFNLSGFENELKVMFQSPGTGVFRALIIFTFQPKNEESFQIVRYVTIRSGDKDMHDIMKPTSPYKKKRFGIKLGNISEFEPPPAPDTGGPPAFMERLSHYRIPPEIQEMIDQNEMDGAINGVAGKIGPYARFWKRLLWASEAQAAKDIMFYDMEGVSLVRQGRFFTLSVPGLAEGRPSVLRGDVVIVTLKKRGYYGRVETTRLEEVVLDFRPKFSQNYQQGVSTVDVRFTFSRTAFRTSHAGVSRANRSMGRRMLFPDPGDVDAAHENSVARSTATRLRWANRNLNPEQQETVESILRGTASSLPFIIFGPPGTGKTTTMVEAVYQLARHASQPKILLVAPSNDAADILIEKLSSFFPPSEMRRILAYSRSLDQVSSAAQPYTREGLSSEGQLREILSARVVVSTVNLAARFRYMGVEVNHFDVLCVDEAGHATEPEVIGVAASLFDFFSEKKQLILAGDPQQLGPIITSELCKRYGMDMSYMERLSKRSPYEKGSDGTYNSCLLVKLIRNYRSHPAILKLPNELFYDNELQQCGDHFVTNSMAKWEHLPKKGFPVMFHAIYGENLREANSPSWFNPQEAQEVVNYVELLMKHSTPKVDAADIGVITPYARQAQKIRLALKTRDLGDVKVGSVETFQGQERRVIIISTVRAENDYVDHDKKYNLGFVSNKKRFNVAVTRAQALLIIIGQPQVLATDKQTWLPLLRMCRDNQSWVGEEWVEGFDASKEEDDLIASVPEENHGGERKGSDDDWVVDGMDRLDISQAVEEEGLGYVNREE